jgi:hypothetical protein
MNPVSGRSSSSIRKIAPETQTADVSKATLTVGLRGANRPQPIKIIENHVISTTSRSLGTPLVS